MLITWHTPSTAGCDRSPAACPALAAPRRGHPTLHNGLLPATLPKISLILPKRHPGTPHQQGLGAELNPGCLEGLGSLPGASSCRHRVGIWDLFQFPFPLPPPHPSSPYRIWDFPPVTRRAPQGLCEVAQGFIPCFTTRLVVYFYKSFAGRNPLPAGSPLKC